MTTFLVEKWALGHCPTFRKLLFHYEYKIKWGKKVEMDFNIIFDFEGHSQGKEG